MSWEDVESGLGVVGAIPGKILGSVVGPVLGGLKSNPTTAKLLSGIPRAYAAGRGNYQAVEMMREQEANRSNANRQGRIAKRMQSELGNDFDLYDPNTFSRFYQILNDEGYPLKDSVDMAAKIQAAYQSQFKFGEEKRKQSEGEWEPVTRVGPDGVKREFLHNSVTRQTIPRGKITVGDGSGRELTEEHTGMLDPPEFIPPTPQSALAVINEWTGSTVAQNMEEVVGRVANLEVAFRDAVKTGNPATFLIAINSFAKTLDPRGVVRKSDEDLILGLQKMADAALQKYKTKIGGKLPEEAMLPGGIIHNLRKSMRLMAESLAASSNLRYTSVRNMYERTIVKRDRTGQFVIDDMDQASPWEVQRILRETEDINESWPVAAGSGRGFTVNNGGPSANTAQPTVPVLSGRPKIVGGGE